MGAELGQGWLYGRPGPLPQQLPPPKHPIELLQPMINDAGTPFDAVRTRRSSRIGLRQLLRLSLHLEYRVLYSGEPTVLLACFQGARRFNAVTRHRYSQLAARTAFTAVVGRDVPAQPAPGIRGAHLRPDDPITHEWCLIVLGPHFAAAVLAKEAHAVDANDEPTFDSVMTFDRDLVIAAARPLLKRILAMENGHVVSV
jgi:DICT domain-containing protein